MTTVETLKKAVPGVTELQPGFMFAAAVIDRDHGGLVVSIDGDLAYLPAGELAGVPMANLAAGDYVHVALVEDQGPRATVRRIP